MPFSQRLPEFIQRVSLSLWWGGLTFYSAVVVPIGAQVLDPTTQGFVTQQVTHWLNGACALALLLTARTVFLTSSRRDRIAWSVLLVSLLALLWVHRGLDAMLDAEAQCVVADDAVFYRQHQWYLWLTVVQWLCGLLLLWPAASRTASESQSAGFSGDASAG